jgi:hypothetical protein
MAEVINGGGSGGGGSLPTDPTFTTVTTTGAISAGGQVSAVATIAFLGSDSTTDATDKSFRFGARHRTNSEEPVAVVVISSSSTTNAVSIGGGSSALNAATQVEILTAANNTTTTGTTRCSWRTTGERHDVGISTTPSGMASRSTWWTDTSGNPYARVGTGRIIDIGALGLTATDVKTSAYTAAAGELVLVDPSAATADITITLPASIQAGQLVEVVLTANAAKAFCVQIGRNGNTVNGLTATANLAMSRAGQRLFVVGQASGAASVVLETPETPAEAIKIVNAVTGYYTIPNHSSIDLIGNVTVGCWLRSVAGLERYIYGGLNLSDPTQGFAFSINTGRLGFYDGAAWRYTGVNDVVNDDVWHLCISTYEAGSPNGTVRNYIDGQLISTATNAAAALVSNTTTRSIGASPTGTAQYAGFLQHVFLVDSALSQADVTTLWNRGRGLVSWPLSTKPVAWWPMDEGGASSTLTDRCNSNTATRTGNTYSALGHVGLAH